MANRWDGSTEEISMSNLSQANGGINTDQGQASDMISLDVPEEGHSNSPPGGSVKDDLSPEPLITRLPSRKASSSGTRNMETWRRRSKKKHRNVGSVRFKHGELDMTDLVDEFVNDPEFVEAPKEQRNEEIRALTTTLSNKRSLRDQVNEAHKAAGSEEKGTWLHRTTMASRQLKYNVAEVTYATDLWRSHLKKIEGHFGTGVTSYFVFLKYLFIINVPVFILSFGFMTTPQILYRWLEQVPPGYPENVSFSGTDLLTGMGWLNYTELYYGAYLNGIISITSGHNYNMQYAYLLTTVGYYVLTTILLGKRLMQSYRRNYININDNFKFYYVAKTFCGWDFSIYDEKAAHLAHKGIFKEFQEYLVAFHEEEQQPSTRCQSFGRFMLRLFLNLAVIALLAGSGYLVWYISATQSLSNSLSVLSDLALPLCISAINYILPFAFSILGAFENYKNPRVEIYLTMIRTILLYITTLGVLIYFWFNTVNCALRDENDLKWLDNELPCQACWENFMGQQIYMLVIVDFLFTLAITFISEFVRRIMSQFCCKSLGFPEFNIGRNTLNLIYSQALIWLGVFYSPLLSFIAIVKLFIMFYVKRFSVVQNCVPSVKPWRAGQTTTLILALLFVTLVMAFMVVAYSVAFQEPSLSCGPYQGQNRSYDVFSELLDEWNANGNSWLKAILEIITSTAFLGFICVALVVAAYYCQVIAKGHKEMVDLLRNQIALEGKDKQFLLKLLQEASRKLVTVSPAPVRTDRSQTPRNSGVSDPRSPGGRQFGKVAAEEGSIHHRDSPILERASKLSDSSSSSNLRQRNSQPQEHYNKNYLEKSLERDIDGAIAASRMPGETHVMGMYDQKTLDPRDVKNAMYQERSPTQKPYLPYQTPPYDIYQGKRI